MKQLILAEALEKLQKEKKGAYIELSNGNSKTFNKEDVAKSWIEDYALCIDDWTIDLDAIIAVAAEPTEDCLDGLIERVCGCLNDIQNKEGSQ